MIKHWILKQSPSFLHTPINIAFTLAEDMNRSDLFKHASAMAYVTLLSLVPSLAAIFALISLFSPLAGGESAIVQKAKNFILDHLASGSGEQAVNQLESLLSNLDTTKIGITGLIGLMVSLILLLRQIELALNKIWLVSRERNLFTRFVYFWTFLTLGTFTLAIAFGSFASGHLNNLMKLGEIVPVHYGISSYLTPVVAGLIFFVVLYKVVPNCFVSWKQALIGAFPAMVLFRLAASSYGIFTARFTNYQAVYGALAAIPLFLLWLYILWLIILFGALLSWRAQQGFVIDEKNEDETIAKSAGEQHRNQLIQAQLPFMILHLVKNNFNQSTQNTINGMILSEKLQLPINWIREAIDLLVEKDLIKMVVDNKNFDFGGSGDSARYPLLPATNDKNYSNLKLEQALFFETKEWFERWEVSEKIELKDPLLKVAIDQ